MTIEERITQLEKRVAELEGQARIQPQEYIGIFLNELDTMENKIRKLFSESEGYQDTLNSLEKMRQSLKSLL